MAWFLMAPAKHTHCSIVLDLQTAMENLAIPSSLRSSQTEPAEWIEMNTLEQGRVFSPRSLLKVTMLCACLPNF